MASPQDAFPASRGGLRAFVERCVLQTTTPDIPCREYTDSRYRLWQPEHMRVARLRQTARSRTDSTPLPSRQLGDGESLMPQAMTGRTASGRREVDRPSRGQSNSRTPTSQSSATNTRQTDQPNELAAAMSGLNSMIQNSGFPPHTFNNVQVTQTVFGQDSGVGGTTNLRHDSETSPAYTSNGRRSRPPNESRVFFSIAPVPSVENMFLLRVRGPWGELTLPAKLEPNSQISLFPMHMLLALGWDMRARNSPRGFFRAENAPIAECSTGSYQPRRFVHNIQVSRGTGPSSPFLTRVGFVYPLPEPRLEPNGMCLVNRTELERAFYFGYIIVGQNLDADLISHSGIYDTGMS